MKDDKSVARRRSPTPRLKGALGLKEMLNRMGEEMARKTLHSWVFAPGGDKRKSAGKVQKGKRIIGQETSLGRGGRRWGEAQVLTG